MTLNKDSIRVCNSRFIEQNELDMIHLILWVLFQLAHNTWYIITKKLLSSVVQTFCKLA